MKLLIFFCVTIFVITVSDANLMFSTGGTKLRSNFVTKVMNNEASKSTVKTKLTLKEMLLAQFGQKMKRRVSVGNVKCSTAFKHNNKTYVDCTKDNTPDGLKANKEWCYLEKNDITEKKWDYCKPDMNFDKIRGYIQIKLSSFSTQCRKLQQLFDDITPKVTTLISNLKETINKHSFLSNQLNNLEKDTKSSIESIKNLETSAKEWESKELECTAYAQEIMMKENELKEMLRVELEAKAEKDSKVVLQETSIEDTNKIIKIEVDSEDSLRTEETMTKIKINPYLQVKNPTSNKDCKGMLGYQEESEGIGLYGKYFNSITYSGDFKTRLDETINFDFTGSQPVDGVSKSAFSVEWEGFIEAPVKARYFFTIDTNGGAELFVAGKRIILHRMYNMMSESRERSDTLLNEFIYNLNNPQSRNYNKKISQGIELSAASKYSIKLRYYTSTTDYFFEDQKTYIKLSWYTDFFDEEIVPTKYLFENNVHPPLKLHGISAESGVLRFFEENDLAFKDSQNYIIKDLPREYIGSKCLKLPFILKEKEINFETNVPIYVYIAKIEHYPTPFSDFEDMNQKFTVLEIDQKQLKVSEQEINSVVLAKDSYPMRIFRKKFKKGKVSIPLSLTGLNSKGVSLILFYGADTNDITPISCGGEIAWISQPGSSHFSKCTQSSMLNSEFTCEAGLNGIMQFNKGSFWSSKSQGEGAFMQIYFNGMYEVQMFTYIDNTSPEFQNSRLQLDFSTGETYFYNHLQISEEDKVEFSQPYKTEWVKITIVGVYGTNNNGGAFKFFGTKCSAQQKSENSQNIEPIFKEREVRSIPIGCCESVSNSKKLENIDKSIGKCVSIICSGPCITDSSSKVYGNKTYSKDSSICRAAIHAGAISSTGGEVKLCFGGESVNLPAEKSFGIQSEQKYRTEMTIRFELLIRNSEIPKTVGTKFDYYDEKGVKWIKAIISDVVTVPVIGSILIIYKDEDSPNNFFPKSISIDGNSLVQLCGSKILNRDCKGSPSNQNKKFSVRFGPPDLKAEGQFVLDSGLRFGSFGKPYGWNNDMTKKIKTSSSSCNLSQSSQNYGNIGASYVEFNPSNSSKFCKTGRISCNSSSWSAKTGSGPYFVKILIKLDHEANVDLQVNNLALATNLKITPGNLVILEDKFTAKDGLITITSNCKENCLNSWSKMNMIEITPANDDSSNKPNPQDFMGIQSDVCGSLKRGPNCNLGKIDPLHCILESQSSPGAFKCSGDLVLVQYKKQELCREAFNKYVCIKKKYASKDECSQHCPGECKTDGRCTG